ncbi:hypothetical protein BH18THE2_BH18THE2_18080 [soil metagenome]
MKHIRNQSMIILMIASIIFIALGNLFSESSLAERQSQTTVCNDDDGTCYTTICSGDQPCQSFPSNDPSSISMQPVEESTVMEPVQEDPIAQPVENELDEEGEDIIFSVDDSQGYLNPVSEEDTLNSPDEDERGQEEANGETEEQVGDTEHEKFEQELNGTPEAVEVETGNIGMGVFVDYIVSDDLRVVENPMRYYNGGTLDLHKGGTISFSFADCHTECDQPDAIRSVYLVDGDIDDNMIIGGNINDGLKAIFEQTDPDSFQFRIPDGVTGSNTFNKLVIETQQTDEISAFYIQQGVEVS